jgi:hypothetical protein
VCVTVITAGLLVTGCGSSSRTGSAARPSPASFGWSFVAFAVCMRAHGSPAYPDPDISSSGGQVRVRISPGSLNPKSPAFTAADHACHGLLPSGGAPKAGADSGRTRAQGLAFAACLRSHGVPTFPDPGHDGAFDLPAGLDPQAPQFRHAERACASVQPSSVEINQAPPGT